MHSHPSTTPHARTHTATHLHEANPRTTALGLTALALLLLVKFLKRRYPPTPAREARLGYRAWRAVATFATLLVVAASALAAWLMDRHGQGIPTVGAIEPGLSRAAFPSWSRLELQTTAVATQAVPLALLGACVRGLTGCLISCAVLIDPFILVTIQHLWRPTQLGGSSRRRTAWSWTRCGRRDTQTKPPTYLHACMHDDPCVGGIGAHSLSIRRTPTKQNQDLFALGVGNLVSSCFSTFVAAGSFGRTALAQVRV